MLEILGIIFGISILVVALVVGIIFCCKGKCLSKNGWRYFISFVISSVGYLAFTALPSNYLAIRFVVVGFLAIGLYSMFRVFKYNDVSVINRACLVVSLLGNLLVMVL